MSQSRSTPSEALSLLDVIFGRAPVGLGFHDLEGRIVRINDRLARGGARDLRGAGAARPGGRARPLYGWVVEASPADEALAPDRLAAFLRGSAGDEAGEIAAAIERKALEVQDGRLRDDVAIVVLRVEPAASFDVLGAGVAQTS